MVVHFPDFLVAGIVVQLQVFLVISSAALNASCNIFVQVDFPFTFGVTLRFDGFPLDLDFSFLFNAFRKWINTSERVFVFLAALDLSVIHRLNNVIS